MPRSNRASGPPREMPMMPERSLNCHQFDRSIHSWQERASTVSALAGPGMTRDRRPIGDTRGCDLDLPIAARTPPSSRAQMPLPTPSRTSRSSPAIRDARRGNGGRAASDERRDDSDGAWDAAHDRPPLTRERRSPPLRVTHERLELRRFARSTARPSAAGGSSDASRLPYWTAVRHPRSAHSTSLAMAV